MTAKKEVELYSSIERMFNEMSFFTMSARKKLPGERFHSPFGVKIDEDTKSKQVDVVAFKWKDDYDIDIKAVECKLGGNWEGVGSALGQATAYQKVFPEVYIASEAEEEKLRHVKSLLDQAGLGYIFVKDNNSSELFLPKVNVRLNKLEFEQQVKYKAALLLAFNELYKGNFNYGSAEKAGYVWVAEKEQPNISADYDIEKQPHYSFNLVLDEKSYVQKVFSKIRAEDFYEQISKLPKDYHIRIYEFKAYKPQRKRELKEDIPISEATIVVIQRFLDQIKGLDYRIQLIIGREVIPRAITKTTILNELKKTQEDLSSIQKVFKSLL